MAYFVRLLQFYWLGSGTMTDADHPQSHPVIAIHLILGAFFVCNWQGF